MKITVIAPIEEIIHTTKQVLKKHEFPVEVELVTGDLESGLQQARQAVASGTDIIISRGGTASLIANTLDVPVVEIEVTAFDVLQALQRVGPTAGPIGVVFVRRFLFECERLGNLIGLPMQEIFMEDDSLKKIHRAYKSGITTFLGDASSVRMLRQHNFTVFPLDSGEDAITKAIIEAINLAKVRRKERERAELFHTIIQSATDGIIAIDRIGQTTIFNTVAEQILRMSADKILGKPIATALPSAALRDCLLSDQAESTAILPIHGKIFAIKKIPIQLKNEIVGSIANLQEVTQLQHFEQTVRQKLNQKGLIAKFHIAHLIGTSAPMEEVKKRIREYAATNSTILISGESGTGKERIAQSIHNLSNQKAGPFVAVNCAALPENLLESELFGYEEGAFTGAKKGGKYGLFELAHGGTLLLDEISEIPLALQARLLRVLQEREVMRLGGNSVIPIAVRILAATNQDLMTLVENNKFRADLYYRLDVLRLNVPPLRDRPEDIPELVHSFFQKTFLLRQPLAKDITPEALTLLQNYYWRGNIRELENVLERTLLLAKGPFIEAADIAREISSNTLNAPTCCDKLQDHERQKIKQILLEEKYNYTKAAKRLGVSRTTLWRRMQEWSK